MTSVWHAKEPFKPPVWFLSREWLDLSPAVIRKRKLRHKSASSWWGSFSHWCSPCSQFLDLMDTIDKQREEIARSGRWVEFLSAFCFLIAKSGPSHFLTEISHIFFPLSPSPNAGYLRDESASCRKHWRNSTLLWIHWKPSMEEKNVNLLSAQCCVGSAEQSC